MATSPPLLVKWLCLALGRLVEDQPDLIAQVGLDASYTLGVSAVGRLVKDQPNPHRAGQPDAFSHREIGETMVTHDGYAE